MTDADVDRPQTDLAAAPRMGRSPRLNQAVLKVVFGVAVVAFGAWFIASRWHRVQAALSTARPAWVVLAAVFGVLGLLCAMVTFREVLEGVAGKLPVRDVGRVHFTSQLGKYVPGSIWPLVALTEMSGRYQMSRRAAASAGVLALVISITTGGIVGVTLVVIAAARTSSSLWWLLLLIPVAFVIGHPSVVMTVLNRLLRLVHREPVEVSLRGAALRKVLLWQFGVWLFLGLHCWALVVALGGNAVTSVVPAIGGFALAFTAGTLFIPAPAGAGIREAVLALALVNVTRDSSAFSHSSVLVVVLLSRVLLAVFDFALAGFWLLMARKRAPEMTTL